MKNAILLIGGIVVTLLVIIFPDHVFEAMYYSNEFSNEMYNEHLYVVAALVTAGVAWGAAALFYYAIDSVSFSRWWHWLATGAVATVAAPVASSAWASSAFTALGYDFSAQLVSFGLFQAILTMAMYAVASFAMRWWSANCRHTPIPE